MTVGTMSRSQRALVQYPMAADERAGDCVHLRPLARSAFEACFGVAGSGWAGGGRRRHRDAWRPGERRRCCGGRGVGPGWGRIRHHPVADVLVQRDEVAAMLDDDEAQVLPQLVARHDAEIAADIGDDRADRPAADLGGDLLRRGQQGKARIGRVCGPGGGWPGRALRRCARGRGWRVRAGCELRDPGFERAGPQQAASDAREDQPDVAGAEREGDEGEVGRGGTLLQGGGEFPAGTSSRKIIVATLVERELMPTCRGRDTPGHGSRRDAWVIINEIWH